MEIEEAVYAILTGTTAVTDLLGTRVFPEQAVQSSDFPLCVYGQAHRKQLRTIAGRRLNLNRYEMHLEVFGTDYPSAKRAYLAVRNAMLDAQGDQGGGIGIQLIEEQTGADDSNPPIHAGENGVFVGLLDVTIHYNQES